MFNDRHQATQILLVARRAERPKGKAASATLSMPQSDGLEIVEPGGNPGDAKKVRCAVLETLLATAQCMHPVLHRHELHGAAGEPGSLQLRERLPPRHEG